MRRSGRTFGLTGLVPGRTHAQGFGTSGRRDERDERDERDGEVEGRLVKGDVKCSGRTDQPCIALALLKQLRGDTRIHICQASKRTHVCKAKTTSLGGTLEERKGR